MDHDELYDVGGVFIGVLAIILLIILISHCHHRRQSPVDPSNHDDDATSVERGLDEATICSYPKMLYSEVKQHMFGNNVLCGTSSSSSTSYCCICLAEFEDKDVLRSVPNCGHFFHQMCVDKWLMLHPTCPVCRNSLVVDPLLMNSAGSIADQV